MGISLLNANFDMTKSLMQTMMQSMRQTSEMATDMVALNVENSIDAEKMQLAQQIIDVYA